MGALFLDKVSSFPLSVRIVEKKNTKTGHQCDCLIHKL